MIRNTGHPLWGMTTAALLALLSLGLVPTVWAQAAPLAATTSAGGELSLTAAVDEALRESPRLHLARAQFSGAEAAAGQRRSSLLPDLVAMGEYARSEDPSLVYPMNGPATQANPLVFDDSIYTAVLQLDVPILDLPSLAATRAAGHGVDAQRARTLQTEQEVIAGVVEIYVQAAQIDDNLSMMDGHIAALERRLAELRILAEAGRVPPASVAELEATLQSVRADRLTVEQRRMEIARRLGLLLGRSELVVPLVPDFGLPPAMPAVGDESVQPVGGPAIAAAEAQLAAAEAGRVASRTSFAPRVSGYARETARSGSDIDFAGSWTLGLTVTLPLFTGGERLARVDAAEAEVEAARISRNSLAISEATERSILADRWTVAAERRDLLRRAADNRARSLAALESRYAEGRASLSDVLAEESTLLELRMHERSTRYDQLLSYVAWIQRAGDLSPALIETLIEE
jgi:outer membrane protein TolC